MKKLTIAPNKRLLAKYHSLLKSEWTSHSTAAAVEFVRQVLTAAGCRLVFHWENESAEGDSYFVESSTSERLRDFMMSFYVDTPPETVPRLPSRRAPQSQRLSRASEALSVLLNIQYLAKTEFQVLIDDKTEFLKNCQSLLVTLGIQFLLPELTRIIHEGMDGRRKLVSAKVIRLSCLNRGANQPMGASPRFSRSSRKPWASAHRLMNNPG